MRCNVCTFVHLLVTAGCSARRAPHLTRRAPPQSPPRGGLGGDGNPWHGRSRCPPPCPLGGGWWGHRSLCRSGSCVPTTGGRNQWPGSPAACGGTSARRGTSAAVTGPRAAALPGIPLRPSVREPCPHGAAARRALAAWHEAERQPGGDGVSAAALTRSRLPRCQRPATDPRRRASGPRRARCSRPAAPRGIARAGAA